MAEKQLLFFFLCHSFYPLRVGKAVVLSCFARPLCLVRAAGMVLFFLPLAKGLAFGHLAAFMAGKALFCCKKAWRKNGHKGAGKEMSSVWHFAVCMEKAAKTGRWIFPKQM